MSHPDETALERYRTRELPAEQHAVVEAHLEACASCRERLTELDAFADRMRDAYAETERSAPAPDWASQREAILARLEGRRPDAGPVEATEPDRVVPGPWARVRGWAPQAAAAAIAILLVGVLWNEGVRDPEDALRAVRSPEAARVEEAREGSTGPRPGPPSETEALDESAPRAAASPDAIERSDRDDGALLDRPVAEREPAPETPADEAAHGAAEVRAGAEGRARDETIAKAAPEGAPPRDAGELAETDRVGGADAAQERRVEARASALEQAALGPADRFESGARRALADRDPERAREVLGLYRDSVEVVRIPQARADTLAALADSLVSLLGALPR